MCVLCVCVFVFCQAEDGIRDLVRSRGLGDVYKRQTEARATCLVPRGPMRRFLLWSVLLLAAASGIASVAAPEATRDAWQKLAALWLSPIHI